MTEKLKVRFSVLSESVLEGNLEGAGNSHRFVFTATLCSPLYQLVSALISVSSSVQVERTVTFIQEPGAIELRFDKSSDDNIHTVLSQKGESKPLFEFRGHSSAVVKSFWRGLKLLHNEPSFEIPENTAISTELTRLEALI